MTENRISILKRYVLIPLGYCMVRLYLSTIRIRILNEESLMTHIEKGGKAIVAFWHQRFFGVIGYAKRFRIFQPSAIISKSLDGDLIAQVAIRLGIRPVRGSSSRGGREALAAMIKDLAVHSMAIHAVDGPKGPMKVVKAGLIRMAQLSGAQIFPVYISVDRAWMVNSWDRFLIPKPFSRILVQWDHPIFVPGGINNKTFENIRLQVEERMMKGHAACDQSFM
jgi:lysophospholipid acyltransferase (LPLAT)-like uncharacterized protein